MEQPFLVIKSPLCNINVFKIIILADQFEIIIHTNIKQIDISNLHCNLQP